MSGPSEVGGPDLSTGVPESALAEGEMLEGQAGGESVLLARSAGELFAVGARCPHYGASLVDGLLVGTTVRCPLHHACFDLRSGDARCAPALDGLPTYEVNRVGGRVRVGARRASAAPPRREASPAEPRSIVIIGTGAAGNAAAEMLRRRGYAGRLTMIGAEREIPYDRPNLSKDYLAGTAPEEWIPLRSAAFYAERGIDLMLGARVTAIDAAAREVRTLQGSVAYDRLLLATGSEVVRLPLVTTNLPNVFYLRTLADSRAIRAAAERARGAVVVGSSFIALEVAAALRARGVAVDVVAPNRRPFERVFGPTLGDAITRLHQAHGVTFHFGETVQFVERDRVTLASGRRLAADMVVVGIGVRPSIALAQWAKLEIDDGVVVDEYLESSQPGIFAAGDIARYVDRRTGDRIRVEHWTTAERQGQAAARNMLGERVPYDDVPFFWSQHYDLVIRYVGHHETWDQIVVDGDVDARDCRVEYRRGGMLLAVATVGRDRESLLHEEAMRMQGRDRSRERVPAVVA